MTELVGKHQESRKDKEKKGKIQMERQWDRKTRDFFF